jgi:uncharacterized protein (DUF1778 family)
VSTAVKETKRQRVEARVTPEQRALIQRAADLTGRSLTDFIVSSVQAAAEEAIRERNVIFLSAEDSRVFAEAVLNPGEPNKHLRAAARDYRAWIGERE